MRYISRSVERTLICLFLLVTLSGCATTRLPNSLGEGNSSFSYIPLDPLSVIEERGPSCEIDSKYKTLLDSLPDQAVRIAVGQYTSSGTLVYGPVSVGVAGERYQIVLDYISVDASNIQLAVQKSTKPRRPSIGAIFKRVYFQSTVKEEDDFRTTWRVLGKESYYEFIEKKEKAESAPIAKAKEDPEQSDPRRVPLQYPPQLVTIPVYVGIGLRLTANVAVTKGSTNLSSLGALSAAAEAGNVSGSLVVQTLGITGKSISTTLPLPSEINPTTIQNAILSLGSIKAVLYDRETQIAPRVVGIYNPIGGGPEFVNDIVSRLARDPAVWPRPCVQQQP